jgi:Asp-tRNA(Asn)/Glu-tRNA(Gln) amidotransferase A subunit family amidase
MPNLLDSVSNLHAALLRRESSARDLLGATLAAIERLVPPSGSTSLSLRSMHDKLAAREHDFLTSDLCHRALQARGMGLSTPDFMRQCLRQEWARFFEHIDVVLCSPAPTGPIGTITSPIRMGDRSSSMTNKGPISA